MTDPGEPAVPAPTPCLAGRPFFARDVLDVARDLLGAVVVHDGPGGAAPGGGAPNGAALDGVAAGGHRGPGVAVRLTEVEAYGGPEDPGSHARAGLTARTAAMFGPPGHAYVYFTYGMHWCLNLVTGAEGSASAVLLRAGEVVDGLDLARSRRAASRVDRDLARGPARLAAALGIGPDQRGADLCAPGAALRVLLPGAPADVGVREVVAGPRTGVSGPGGGPGWPWRLHLDGEVTVSPYRAAAPRRRSGRVDP